MSDTWPAEAEPNAEWLRVLDGLIERAIAQADAAVEEICGYLNQRPAKPPTAWRWAAPAAAPDARLSGGWDGRPD